MRTPVTIILLLIFEVAQCYAQVTKILEGKISPDGKLIALDCFAGSNEDLFLYNIENDSLIRITNSTELLFGLQYKRSLNWIDNNKLLFLSKHSGIVQQYILDVKQNSLVPNGTSPNSEYNLCFSKRMNGAYYISIVGNNEPAVFKRNFNSNIPIKVSKGNINYAGLSISSDEKYLFYKEMPIGKPIIYSILENKELKLNLPRKNTTVLGWSANSRYFAYKSSKFTTDGIPLTTFEIYDLSTNTHHTIVKDVDNISNAIWSPTDDNIIGYSLYNKFFIYDINTNKKTEYEVSGNPVDWSSEKNSILFIEVNNASLLNVGNSKISKIL